MTWASESAWGGRGEGGDHLVGVLLPAEGSDGTDGRWRTACKVAPDRVISLVDPQARHTRKSRSQRPDGYRAHLVAEPACSCCCCTEPTPVSPRR